MSKIIYYDELTILNNEIDSIRKENRILDPNNIFESKKLISNDQRLSEIKRIIEESLMELEKIRNKSKLFLVKE